MITGHWNYKWLFLFIICMLIVSLPGPTGCETATPAPAPIKVTAAELYAEYDANEVAADLKYRDKLLEVCGIVTEIVATSQITGKPVVFLAESLDAPFMEGVTAHLSTDQKVKLATLSKGDTITVRGICEGITLVRGTERLGIRGVLLKNCSLVETSAPIPTAPFRIEDISLTRASLSQCILTNNSSESIFIYKIVTFGEYHWPRPGSPGSPTSQGSSTIKYRNPKEVKPGQSFTYPDNPELYDVGIKSANFFIKDGEGESYEISYNIDVGG